MNSTIKKMQQREFWPLQYLYTPIFAYWLRNSIRAWRPMYLYDTNPGMKPTSFLRFSKRDTLEQIEEKYVPKTIIVKSNSNIDIIKLQKNITNIGGYPLIAKPDVGERGQGVEYISNKEELLNYLYTHSGEDILIQEFIQDPIELGVMYYRYPDQQKGTITGITMKEFFSVTGDGVSSLRELVQQHPRGNHYSELFSSLHGDKYDEIIPNNESKILNNIGNHCKGTTFTNASNLITPELIKVFDTIAKSIDGFYYGRFDVKIASLEKMYAGEGISILEVNGIQSEPAHIYDPSTSLRDGYTELFRHRITMYKISKYNRRKRKTYVPLNLRDHICDEINYTKNKNMYAYNTKPIHSLPDLVKALQENIQRQKELYGNIDLYRSKHIIDLYIGSDRKQYATFKTGHYTRNAVKLPIDIVDFDVYIIGREGNYMSKIHDHADNGCVMKVLTGELVEKRYTRDYSGQFHIDTITYINQGTTSYIHDEIGYHALGTESSERSVGLHLYSPALYKTNYFHHEE